MKMWISLSRRLPPENVKLETKIVDSKRVRNKQTLIYSKNLFWLPDMSMYVYYTPTHWREK